MKDKKIDWDFRIIMCVMGFSAVFGAWLCTKAYPAEWQAIKDAVAGVFVRIGSFFGALSDRPTTLVGALVLLTCVILIVNNARSRA